MDAKSNEMQNLDELADRVTSLEVQIVQLRDEMRAEFSATRAEAREGNEDTRHTLREEIRAGDQETRRLIYSLHDEAMTQMRVLHEDLVERIKLIDRG